MDIEASCINNTSNFIILIGLVILSICLSSCTHSFYVVNDAHTLGLEEKGDIKVNGTTLELKDAKGFGFKAGYSPKENIGIQLAYASLKDPSEKGFMLNTGLGYYKTLFEKKEKSKDKWLNENSFTAKILFDTYLGFAFGKSVNQYYKYNFSGALEAGAIKMNMNQYYAQSGLHFSFWYLFQFSLAYRFSVLDFTKATVISEISEKGFSDLDAIVLNNPFLLNELSTKITFGIKPINLFFTSTFGTTNKYFPFGSRSFQVGMASDLNFLHSQKSKN